MTDHAEISALTQRLIREIEDGLPLVPRPYAAIAEKLNTDESRVLDLVRTLSETGVIKRLGVVVRHHELGYRSNAMVVWDIPDQQVDELGELFGQTSYVTLCYRRPRRLPAWPYNLFTMIHGRDRNHVLSLVEQLRDDLTDGSYPYSVLFSARRFKQRGARYSGAGVKGFDARRSELEAAEIH